MSDDEVRLWSEEELREYILTGTAEDWAEISRRFTREELEELKRFLYPPPVPGAVGSSHGPTSSSNRRIGACVAALSHSPRE